MRLDVRDTAARFDARLGDGLERAICTHHRRRLRRVGWDGALDAPPGFTAPRAFGHSTGNAVEVIVDGSAALPRIAEAIRGARRTVHLAGWFFSPDFDLTRGQERTLLVDLLRETAARGVEVRVLAWAGAPLPVFRPSRRLVASVLETLRAAGVHAAGDAHERPLHCHHEKLVIVDDELAFVGGIDLTDLAGDRFDRAKHPPRDGTGWHDAAALLHGPAVADVAGHFALRWHAVTGEALAAPTPPAPAGDVALQLLRTIPEHVYDAAPEGDFSILQAYTGALRAAQRLIYLENQFLWSPEIVAILAAHLQEPPSDAFRLVVLLPAHPNSGGDDTSGQLGVLRGADRDRRLVACTIVAHGQGTSQPVYVHAKIGIVDDHWLTLGSANLNEHSLFNDTEVNIAAADPALAAATRHRLWAEHLETDVGTIADVDPTALVDEVWRPIAGEQLRRRQVGEPPTHGLVEIPHLSSRSRRLLGPVQGLLVDG
jgi:phosphatidylserine/phosphatidylglycerophosphate/cardiolipin synthase-like enzyme